MADATDGGSTSEYEVFISAGGVTAVLAGVGFQLAGEVAGVSKWKRIHGASGGSIVGAVAACGHSPKTLTHMALDLSFGEHVNWKRGILGAPFTNPFQCSRAVPDRYSDEWRECHWYGLLGTEGVGDCIETYAEQIGMKDKWPTGYTCVATTRYGDPVLFHDGGILLVRDGKHIVLSDEPAPLALAVRASCTIGGIMTPLSYKGNVLFDGGLSRYGFCPVGMQIDHLGSSPKKMIAVRVNEVHPTTFIGKVHRGIRWAWWIHPDFHWGPETEGVIEIYPPIQHVPTLKFALSRDEKWLAILLAFNESLAVMAMEGILVGEKLERARAIMADLGFWRDFQPAPLGKRQDLSSKVQRVFTHHGLY